MDAEVLVRAEDFALTRKLQWLALSLTPGVGAGRENRIAFTHAGAKLGGADGYGDAGARSMGSIVSLCAVHLPG